jgi:hypothetical protein
MHHGPEPIMSVKTNAVEATEPQVHAPQDMIVELNSAQPMLVGGSAAIILIWPIQAKLRPAHRIAGTR